MIKRNRIPILNIAVGLFTFLSLDFYFSSDKIDMDLHIKATDQREHGTIIRTGITCKKIPCYMRDSACRWLIVEKDKIFRSYVKYF